MANRLDDIFGKKLGNRQFSPKESDWAAMESMIDASSGISPTGGSISINWMFAALFVVLTTISTITAVNERSNSKEIASKNKSEIPVIKASSSTTNLTKDKATTAAVSTNPKTVNTLHPTQSTLQSDGNNNAGETSQNNLPSLRNSENKIAEQNDGSISNKVYTNTPFEKMPIVSSTIPSEKAASNNMNNEVKASVISEKKLNKNTAALTGLGITFSTTSLANNNPDAFNNSPDNKLPETAKAANTFSSTSIKSISGNEDDETYFAEESAKYKAAESSYITKGNINTSLFAKKNLILSSSTIRSLGEINKGEIVKTSTYSDPITLQKTKTNKGFRTLPIQFSIAAFGEVSLITKKISGDNEFSSLIATRNREEDNIISFGGGIEFQAKYKGIGFNTGLYLSKWGENIQYDEKYRTEWEVSDIVVSDTLWMEDIVFTYDSLLSPIDSTTWIVYVIDSTFITTVDTVLYSTVSDSSEVFSPVGLAKQNGKTTISYWEIPLYFNYQFDMGDFYLTPGIGVTIGFLKITQGYYMAKDESSLIPIDTDYAVIRRTIINGQLNLGVGYHLNENFSIELTPAYKFNLNNIFENSGIDQRYKAISLQFRLRYYF